MTAPTTEEYWDVDGEILNTWAYNISTLGGRLGLPSPSGPSYDVPYREGELWRPQVAQGRTLTLAMWVRGVDEAGNIPPGDSLELIQFNENWDRLVKALYKPWRQMVLTKRWKLNDGTRTASALCSYAGGLDPTFSGRTIGKFGVDLRLSNPWFYGGTLSTLPLFRSSGGNTETLFNEGHTHAIGYGGVVTLHGPLSDVQLTATQTGRPTVRAYYHGSILAGQKVDLDINKFLATMTKADGTTENVIGNISHSGHRSWMVAWKGTTTYQLTQGTGSGYVTVAFRTPYA